MTENVTIMKEKFGDILILLLMTIGCCGFLILAIGCKKDVPLEPVTPECQSGISVANVTVDFSQSVVVSSASGFLIGNQLNTCRSVDMIQPLAPKLIRGAPQRPLLPNAKYHWLVSNIWGFPRNNWNDKGPPYENIALFKEKVMAAVTEFVNTGLDSVLIFDIWNEPNVDIFFEGTELQYHQTFVAAVEAIRAVLPDARIAGPSWSFYNPEGTQRLLDFCLANNCQFDVLSWHELLGPGSADTHPGLEISTVTDHLNDARSRFLNAPQYSAIGLREIHINEYVGSVDQYRPGEFVAYLSALELGGADLAAHACWGANNGSSNCFNCSLDGFVDPGALQPRTKWWVNKIYAENVSGRVAAASDNSAIVPLASISTSDTISVLLGHTRQTTAQDADLVCVNLKLTNLPASFSNKAMVKVLSLPNQDETVLLNPSTIFSSSLSINNGRAEVVLESFPLHDAWGMIIYPL